MKKALTVVLLSLSLRAQTQVVSKFIWSSSPLTTAATGPNGTSVSTSAYSEYIGAPLNYAINPGTPTKNIDLIIPGATLNIPSIDIDLYFRREESVASFFRRGSLMDFGMKDGSLYVNFTTTQGSAAGVVSVKSGNILSMVDDHKFHHYRFKYDNNTGVANVWVDEVIVYTYTGIAGRPLSWTNAGDAIVGENMDATSRKIAVLSNFTIQNPAVSSSLPVELLSFTAKEKNASVLLEWNTVKEMNMANFVIERSENGKQFAALKTVPVSGSYTAVRQYRETDASISKGVVYYRLKMVDIDGKFTYSAIVKVNLAATATTINCFPNPAIDYVTLSIINAQAGIYDFSVATIDGRILKAAAADLKSGAQQVRIDLTTNMPSGVLIIQLHNRQADSIESFKIVRK